VQHRFYNQKRQWNLGTKVDNSDAELYAVDQTLIWAIEIARASPSPINYTSQKRTREIWIFTDSQESIRKFQKYESTEAYIHSKLKNLYLRGYKLFIHWVPSHTDIIGNELADKAAKAALEMQPIPDIWMSRAFIKRKIKAETKKDWIRVWNAKNPTKVYRQFERIPGDTRIKWLDSTDRLISTTIQQFSMGQGYFRSWLGHIPGSGFDTRACPNPRCRGKWQTPEHLLLRCFGYAANDQKKIFSKLARELGIDYSQLGLATLLMTKVGIKYTIQYIKETKIGTRKWILGHLDDEIEFTGGWGDLGDKN